MNEKIEEDMNITESIDGKQEEIPFMIKARASFYSLCFMCCSNSAKCLPPQENKRIISSRIRSRMVNRSTGSRLPLTAPSILMFPSYLPSSSRMQ